MPLSTETMEVKEEKWEWICFWTPDREKILEQTLTSRIDELAVFNENKLETLPYELSLSQNRILEELERMKMKWKRTILWKEHYKSGYNQALQDIIKLISKKDNQSTLTKGN